MMIRSFDTVRRIVFGFGAVDMLVEEIKRVKGTKVLVVTDPGIKSVGIVDVVTGVLDRAKVAYKVFAEVEPDPSVEVALAGIEAAKAYGPDVIVGLGGGSSLDILESDLGDADQPRPDREIFRHGIGAPAGCCPSSLRPPRPAPAVR